MMNVEEKLGKVGNCMSVLCLIHCIAFPALGFLPAIGLSFLLTGWAELLLIWSAIGVSAFGMCWGYRKHRRVGLMLILLLLVASAAGYYHLAFNSRNHMTFMLLGGVSLALGNFANRKFCKNCDHCKVQHGHQDQAGH